jgi:hypothetical protein
MRYRAADCVGSCIPDWAVSQPIANQIKAIGPRGDGSSRLGGVTEVSIRLFAAPACLVASKQPKAVCSVRVDLCFASLSRLGEALATGGEVVACAQAARVH